MENKEKKYPVNWEKISVYLAIMVGFLTVIVYIADIKERIRALEVKFEYLEKVNPLLIFPKIEKKNER